MTNPKDDHSETSIFRSSRFNAGSGAATNAGRQEPGFNSFSDSSQEEYEEPERDTDYFSGYNAEDEHHEEEQDDLFISENDKPAKDVPIGGNWSSLTVAHTGNSTADPGTEPSTEPSTDETANHTDETANHTAEPGTDHTADPEPGADYTTDRIADTDAAPAAEEDPEDPADWDEEEDDYEPEDPAEPAMPLRLIAVAVVALLLLTIGAYGVLQERAAMQEELRELRASLATGAKESDLVDTREALRDLQAAYDTLDAQSSALFRENVQLQASIAALKAGQAATGTEATAGTEAPETEAPETQKPVAETVANVEEKPAQPAAPVEEVREEAPPPAPAVKPAPVASAAAAPASAPAPATASAAEPAPPGNWFVNFGSYGSRDTAQGWAAKLSPVQGEVVVVTGTKGDRTYYRVRVVGLSGKSAAELVARQLEAEMQVSRLWVGQQQ